MAKSEKLTSFFEIFDNLNDHRIDRRKMHPIREILLVTLAGTAAGCEGWSDIELFGKQRLETLREYCDFTHGIPSDDTLRRFFRAVNPEQFQTLFIEWACQWNIKEKEAEKSKTLAIDGKTSRGSRDGATNALHLVSAYAVEEHLVFGQVAVDEKSNEITAIPKLLEVLDLTDTTVTIDAMGCQHAIAKQIIEQKGDYLLSLKGNQSSLHEDVKTWFQAPVKGVKQEVYQKTNKGHGRLETREITVCTAIDWLRERHPQWLGLQSIIKVSSLRKIGDKESHENRYYISSLNCKAEHIATKIRHHWGIENQLHWILDVSFGEDQSRIRKGHAAHNMAVIRHSIINAMNLTRKTKTKKISIKQSRKLAGWNSDVLRRILDVFF